MIKFIKDMLTEVDRETYDISKLLWLLGVIVFLVLSIMAVIEGQPWNPAQYGIGFGSVLAGGGAGVKLKGLTSSPNKKDMENHG